MAANTNDLRRRGWRQMGLSVPLLAAALFAPAGSLRFWQGWLFGCIFVGASLAIGTYFLKHDPELVERRMTVGPKAEIEPAQKVIMVVITVGFFLLMVLPGFDYRWHWSSVPSWLVLVANGFVALSFVIFFVVLKQNSYAASTVRVEAGQPVISTGAYAIVRHPLYSGALLLLIVTPLALGSNWTLPVVVLLIPVLVWRLIEEERFLLRNLPGYADYCRRTPYRLIPLLW